MGWSPKKSSSSDASARLGYEEDGHTASKAWNGASVHFRLLGIEKGIERTKEDIRSKGFTRGSQEVENRAPHGPLMRPRVSLGTFRKHFCPGPMRPQAILVRPR
ncbi:hypothetical protein PIB30_059058 [Stylosanthes scabra]|uniref:Uncharacterized protein n=1 Tax=Stylosanthes scabra TaxID=79078 RepID=A0ABU6QJL4_9FABA|nr:hypothetical protein [Stylosanthes scabra]